MGHVSHVNDTHLTHEHDGVMSHTDQNRTAFTRWRRAPSPPRNRHWDGSICRRARRPYRRATAWLPRMGHRRNCRRVSAGEFVHLWLVCVSYGWVMSLALFCHSKNCRRISAECAHLWLVCVPCMRRACLHISLSQVSHMNTSCLTYDWVMSLIRMRQLSRMNAPCLICM